MKVNDIITIEECIKNRKKYIILNLIFYKNYVLDVEKVLLSPPLIAKKKVK
jgi:hypothetical protein